MTISVLTPDKQLFQGNIISVKVPGTLGQFQVLKNHAPIVSSLEAGEVHIVTAAGGYEFYDEISGNIQIGTDAGRTIKFTIGGGFIEVSKNVVSLLVHGTK